MTVPNEPLKPRDFPLATEDKKITTSSGDEIADAKNEATAEDIKDRLNNDHDREEEDRWA